MNLYDDFSNNYEIYIITGLSQTPHPRSIYYWRFREHKKTLEYFLEFKVKVLPRMTRDFEIILSNTDQKNYALNFFKDSYINNQEQKAFGYIDGSKKDRIFVTFNL